MAARRSAAGDGREERQLVAAAHRRGRRGHRMVDGHAHRAAGGKLRRPRAAARAKLRKIADEAARLPVLDDRSPDELLGYNEWGTFD